jgi:hypothetical protein
MTKEIPLTKGYVALVDDDDFDWLSQFKWHISHDGYAVRTRYLEEQKTSGKVSLNEIPLNIAPAA